MQLLQNSSLDSGWLQLSRCETFNFQGKETDLKSLKCSPFKDRKNKPRRRCSIWSFGQQQQSDLQLRSDERSDRKGRGFTCAFFSTKISKLQLQTFLDAIC